MPRCSRLLIFRRPPLRPGVSDESPARGIGHTVLEGWLDPVGVMLAAPRQKLPMADLAEDIWNQKSLERRKCREMEHALELEFVGGAGPTEEMEAASAVRALEGQA